jgi:uncharacterized protein
MSTLKQMLKSHSLAAGLLLMFLLTWPIDLANSGILPFRVPFAVYIFLGWGFIFAALLMTAITLGKQAAIDLLKRFLIWRVHWKWYLAAFLLFPAIYAGAVLLHAALARTPPDFNTVMAYQIFGPAANLPLLVLPFFLFDAITNGEEMGWRGYVLPRLQARTSALAASLILGLIWGFWHLPKYFASGSTGPFGLFMVKMMAESVLYTWLYNRTKGSLLLVTILHAAGNTAGVFLPVGSALSGQNLNVMFVAIMLEILLALGITIHRRSIWLTPGLECRLLVEFDDHDLCRVIRMWWHIPKVAR